MQPSADVLDAYSWDDPEAYIAGDRRRALLAGRGLPDRVTGAALFADLSGFTPLTEAMHVEYGPTRGAEQLTATLATVFDAVLAQLHRHSGTVVYFSGDAVTCWLDGDDGTVAAACGLAMQQAMADVSRVVLPSGQAFAVGLKVAIAVGAARRWVVGDPDIQLIDVLAGRLIDDLAAAEGAATPGDVVLDESALIALGDRVQIGELRSVNGRTCGVLDRILEPVALPEPPPAAVRLPDEMVRPWLLPPVWERLRTGRGEFLAELRPAIPFFVRFGGIDFDDDPHARDLLNDFIVRSQRVIDAYGGAALQLTLGDKGAYLYAVFGSPIAHEDDEARACAAALDVLALQAETAVTDIQIGIAEGRLRSGTYGHQRRRTFCCLGDAVNLAARLMTSAAAGSILVADAVQRATAERFDWRQLPDLKVKGKKAPVVAFELLGRRSGPVQRRHEHALVGRQDELARLTALLDRAAAGQGQVVGVRGEAGMGKSRLLAEVIDGVEARGFAAFQGEAQPFGTLASYFIWRPVWSALLSVPDGDVGAVRESLAATVGELTPDLIDRLPLLGAVLGADLPETDLTQWLDPKLRKASLASLLVALLREFVRRRGPVVVALEDCHWLDPLSADLLDVLARAVDDLPVVLLIAYRSPDRDAAWLDQLTALPHWTEIELDELDGAAARQLIVAAADALFGLGGDVPAGLVDLVLERSGGSPFHVQELLSFLRAREVDPRDAAALEDVQVPARLHSLVLGRIDLLDERVRRTAKVASVIGRAFDVRTLHGAYPALGSPDDVLADLTDLQSHDLVLREDVATLSYLFRHVVVRDVAYDSLPFSMRARLHERVADWLEQDPVLASAGRHRLDLLAHHYWHTENSAKKREYLTLAGEAAALDYANSVALDYFRRAAELGTAAQRATLLLKSGRVEELVGDWDAAERSFAAALELAEQVGDRLTIGDVLLALAEVARKRGRYGDAGRSLAAAEREFVFADEDAGLAKVLHLTGTVASQQGHLDEARERYTMSLEIRRRLGDRTGEAAILSNLAVVAEHERDYAKAQSLNEQALRLRSDIGDRWALGVSHTNLGMVLLLQDQPRAARDHFVETLRLSLAVGDPWMAAVTHHNLANAERDLGDLPAAIAEYLQALRAYRGFGDRWSLALLLEDLAAAASAGARLETALRLAGAADALRDELGSPRSPSEAAALEAAVASAAVEAGTEPRSAGRLLSDDEIDSLISGLSTSFISPG